MNSTYSKKTALIVAILGLAIGVIVGRVIGEAVQLLVAEAATVFFPAGPLTKGDLVVGSSSTQYSLKGVGTNGKVLTASSTAPAGVSWETAGAGSTPGGSITQLQYNGSGTFAGDANLTWTSSTALFSVNGIASSSQLRSPSSTFGGVRATQTSTFTGYVGIGNTNPTTPLQVTGTSTFDSNILAPNLRLAQSFVIENPSATEDDAFLIFDTTSTITKVMAVNKSTGDTATFNLVHATSRNQATSTASKLFASYQAVTATTTASCFAVATTTTCGTGTFGANASTTVATGSTLRLSTTAASSSQFTLTVWYTTP
jgi:hypothetical protein